MAKKFSITNEILLRKGRFLLALIVLLIAAAHLSSTGGGGSMGTFNPFGFWFSVEIVVDVVIAVVFVLGLCSWYLPSVLFNAFNLAIYLLSGIMAIPGITNMANPNHLNLISSSFTMNIITVGWISALILGLVLLKYDKGSKLDGMLASKA